jgi:hypothetical protein
MSPDCANCELRDHIFLRNGRLFEVIRSVENNCINTRTMNGHINESGRLFDGLFQAV